ncbi:MAG: LysM peptidoglycan-binding domain-containing protein [Bacteroidaceae bacterium]|nr:LysM peptidoglycan-binding domain-containing protein [Bacteroidaceae bacterium]
MRPTTNRSLAAAVLMAMALLLSLPAVVRAQTSYVQHTVEAHETLYGLSRRYGVTIEAIEAANPGVSSTGLRRGQVVRIPQTAAPGSAATAGSTLRHTVQAGETLWGIAHQYGVSVDALRQANPAMQREDFVLQAGAVLLIPGVSAAAAPSAPGRGGTQTGNNGMRVALVMPLKAQRDEVARCKEFYNGALLAADDLGRQGRRVVMYVYEEDPADAQLTEIRAKLRANPVDIIYGPLYPTHFRVLADYARSVGTRLVIPFSSKAQEVDTNPSVYVVNTPEKHRNPAAAEVVARQFGRTHLVFLSTPEANETAFVAALRTKAAAQGATFSTLPVNFADRDILGVFSSHDRVLFVPDGSTEADYKAVLARLDRLRAEMPLLSTSLLAYPDWQRHQDTDRMTWYACDTYLFAPSFYNPYDDQVKVFVRKYRDRFGQDMQPYYPRYGALGYDVVMQTATPFFRHRDLYHGQEAEGVTAVQSHLRFTKTAPTGGYANTNTWLVHFAKERRIEVIGVR